jgi:hypothetical protein
MVFAAVEAVAMAKSADPPAPAAVALVLAENGPATSEGAEAAANATPEEVERAGGVVQAEEMGDPVEHGYPRSRLASFLPLSSLSGAMIPERSDGVRPNRLPTVVMMDAASRMICQCGFLTTPPAEPRAV